VARESSAVSCQEVLCILESLLCGGSPLRCFGPSLQEICQRAQNLCAVGQNTEVKIYHAEKMLQLFDVLSGWAKLNFGGMIDHGGGSCRRNCVAKNSQRRGCKNAFSRLTAKPLAAKAVKKASRWRRCVRLSGEPTRESSNYANTPSKSSVVQPIILL
jgi:hypothetical protein